MSNTERRSFWNRFFKKPERPVYDWENILSGVTPVYQNGFGKNIYASDVVQQAIYSIVTEIKKLEPQHVRMNGSDPVPVTGNIQSVLDFPNPLMTTSDYLEKIIWNLLLNYNSFIYPIWEGNTLVALYPLQPSKVEFQQEESTDEYFVQFTFPNGYTGRLPYDNIIHIRYKYSVSDYMGGNKNGQPDFNPLLDTLSLNDNLLKGLAKLLNVQTQILGVAKIKTMQNKEDQIKAIKEFEDKLKANASGILPLDVTADYSPITKQVNLLDETVLKFIDEKILRTFGVPISIVNGDYTKEQYEAFYQKTLEPIIKSISQAHTKGIFSKHETSGFNNRIMFYAKELIFMNTSQKLEMIRLLGDSGAMYENEKRVAFGLKPIPELEGMRMMSLNYVDVNNASKYQVGTNTNSGEGE